MAADAAWPFERKSGPQRSMVTSICHFAHLTDINMSISRGHDGVVQRSWTSPWWWWWW